MRITLTDLRLNPNIDFAKEIKGWCTSSESVVAKKIADEVNENLDRQKWYEKWKIFADLLSIRETSMTMNTVINNYTRAIEALFTLVFTRVNLRSLKEAIDNGIAENDRQMRIGEISGVMQSELQKELKTNPRILILPPTWQFTPEMNPEM